LEDAEVEEQNRQFCRGYCEREVQDLVCEETLHVERYLSVSCVSGANGFRRGGGRKESKGRDFLQRN
jgi:hypothetical protein